MKKQNEIIILADFEYSLLAADISGNGKEIKIEIDGKDVTKSCTGLIMVKEEVVND